MKNKIFEIFFKGIISENPILILMLGLCPVLACSGSAYNSLGMGIAVIFVLTTSNMIISALRKYIPSEIRIPMFIIIIATFVTITDYILKGYSPLLSKNLGIFIPLIVVNCIILAKAETFAYRNTPFLSFLNAIAVGIGFTLVILLIGIIREVFGSGTIFNSPKFIKNPSVMMILPPGAFLVMGLIVSLVKYIGRRLSR